MWLNKLNMPHLSVEESANFDKLITIEESRVEIQSMQKGKSPGFDGITPEFYATFWEQLGPLTRLTSLLRRVNSQGM